MRSLISTRFPLVLNAVLASSVIASALQASEPAPPQSPAKAISVPLVTEWNVRYSHGDEPLHVGDLFHPQALSDRPQQRVPAVVMIHGGAWTTGSKFHTMGHAKRLAARGYVVFSINYRLAPQHPFPAQFEDCKRALQWVVANAERLQIDTSKIGVWGYSAGGHLASLLALQPEAIVSPPLPNTENQNEIAASKSMKDEEANNSSNWKIAACVCGGTPFDLVKLTGGSSILDPIFVRNPAHREQALAEASPTERLHKAAPPFFLFHGTADQLVPIEQSVEMQKRLQSQKGTCDLISLPDQGHLTTFFASEAISQSFDFFDQAMNVDSTWLEEQGRRE